MREIRPSGLEGGAGSTPGSYPYRAGRTRSPEALKHGSTIARSDALKTSGNHLFFIHLATLIGLREGWTFRLVPPMNNEC